MDNSTKSAKSNGTNASRLSAFSTSSKSIREMLSSARKSFMRSSGERGASVETLRGKNGADFEGSAKIQRGNGGGCSCGGGGKKEKYVLVKGTFCFVYNSMKSLSPNYAISLSHIRPVTKNNMVLLQSNLGDTEFELTFHDDSQSKKFSEVVKKQASAAETEEVRKNLGHEHLLNKRQSVRYAEAVALKKLADQPSDHLGPEEYGMDTPNYAM